MQLILEYSVDTTAFGKIAVSLNYQEDKKTIIIDIKDSGMGLTNQELANIQHPFSGQVLNASRFNRSGSPYIYARLSVKDEWQLYC